MALSVVIIGSTSIPLAFLNGGNIKYMVYPLAAIQGVGIAIMLNTATSLISDVIGSDSDNSAFVYGCYSLLDKFANGFLLFWIIKEYSENGEALKWILALVPTITAFLSWILTFIGNKYFSHKLAKITGLKK